MNNQKQDQVRQQQQQQQLIQQQQQILQQGNSNNMIINKQVGGLSNHQINSQQQSQQILSNPQKNNQSFTTFLSGVNDLVTYNNNQYNLQNQVQQSTQVMQNQNSQQIFPVNMNGKAQHISAFTIKIGQGKLKLANSVDLRPFVQVYFAKKFWRTQVNSGCYPKWNEEKRFEIQQNKGYYDINNPNGMCSSSSTTQSSCSSISPQQPPQNQSIFQQQQILSSQLNPSILQDWNIEIIVLHKSQNDDIEVELGRTSLNIEEQQTQRQDWFCIYNNSGFYGSVQIQFQFEYINLQLQLNKNSHLLYLNQKSQIKSPQNHNYLIQQTNQFQLGDDGSAVKSNQMNIKNSQINSVNITPQISSNKRSPSAHSDACSFQVGPQSGNRIAQQGQYFQENQDAMNIRNQQNFINMNNPQQIGNGNIGYQFRQYDVNELMNQIQIDNDLLLRKDRMIKERQNQVLLESSTLLKEQAKLELQQKNIKSQEASLNQKQQGLNIAKNEVDSKIAKLEQSKKLLQFHIQEYENLLQQEKSISNSNKKIKEEIRQMNQEEPQVVDTLNAVSKNNNSQILQLKIFKLRMINHLKEINSLFYNSKPVGINNKIPGQSKSVHQRAKSYTNHTSFGVDTITDYSVALKNVQMKISQLTDIINTKNYEIESLRDQIINIQSNYDDQ